MSKIKYKYPILRLYSSFFQGGILFTISSFVLWIGLIPLMRLLMVVFPQKVVEAIASGRSLLSIVSVVAIFQLPMTLIPIYESIYISLIRDKAFARVEAKIKENIFIKAVHTDFQYVDEPSFYEDYTWAIKQQAQKAKESFELINEFISCILIIISIIALLSIVNPWVILLSILGSIFRTIGYVKYSQVELEADTALTKIDRRLDYFHRIFYLKEYAQDLRSTSLPLIIQKYFSSSTSDKICNIMKYGKRKCLWMIYADLAYRIFYFATIIVVIVRLVDGDVINAAEYITIMLAVDRLDETFLSFFSLFQKGIKLNLYAKRIFTFYDKPSRIEEKNEGVEINSIPFSLEISNLSFSYSNSNFRLSNISMHINKGEHIAIVGENGVGKTTLVKLLLGLYTPSQGVIKINDINLTDYNIHNYRENVGVVFQDTNIYAISLEDNLSLYSNASYDILLDDLRECGFSDIHRKDLSRMMTKEFEEQGFMVSGGEAQKIALARIMHSDFGLLIMDEASSALDPIAEYHFTNQILNKAKGITTIMIAHRLSSVRDADRILVMSSNGIIEEGTHEELIRKNGKYKEMFLLQAEKYK